MESKPTAPIRSGTPVNWLWRLLEAEGITRAEAFSALDLDKRLLVSDSGIMPIKPYLNLLSWAAERLEMPLFGVYIAQNVAPTEFGIIGHLINNGRSLREVFDFMERYHCIFSPDFRFLFSDSNGSGKFHYQEAQLIDADARVDIDFGMALLVNVLRGYTGDDWHPLSCSFCYPEPKDSSAHRAFFGESLSFNQPHNTVEFELELLDTINPNADLTLLPILLNQANQLLDKLQTQVDIVHKVRLLITTSLGYALVTNETIAARLNISVRQLHRLLAERDTSFRKIKDETLLQVAKEALIETDLSITEVAMKLNYSETSALDRMFKKQVGITPLQYRKKFAL